MNNRRTINFVHIQTDLRNDASNHLIPNDVPANFCNRSTVSAMNDSRSFSEHSEDCSNNDLNETAKEDPALNNIRQNRRQIDFSLGVTNARSL